MKEDGLFNVPTFGLWNSLAETNLSVHRHVFIITPLTIIVKLLSNKLAVISNVNKKTRNALDFLLNQPAGNKYFNNGS